MALVDSTIYKNYLLMTCGGCKAVYQVPGLARKQQQQQQQQLLAQGSAAKASRAKQTIVQRVAVSGGEPKKYKLDTRTTKDSEDFISLPSSPSLPTKQQQQQQQAKRSNDNMGQQRVQSRSKRKKASKNKLMDFLSSLND
jgi:hypothetical protein